MATVEPLELEEESVFLNFDYGIAARQRQLDAFERVVHEQRSGFRSSTTPCGSATTDRRSAETGQEQAFASGSNWTSGRPLRPDPDLRNRVRALWNPWPASPAQGNRRSGRPPMTWSHSNFADNEVAEHTAEERSSPGCFNDEDGIPQESICLGECREVRLKIELLSAPHTGPSFSPAHLTRRDSETLAESTDEVFRARNATFETEALD